MAVVIKEVGKRRARDGADPSTERKYHVTGAAHEIDAALQLRSWIVATGIATLSTVTYLGCDVEDTGALHGGLRTYLCTAHWGSVARAEPQQPSTEAVPVSEEEWDLGVESVRLYVPRVAPTVYVRTPLVAPAVKLIGDRGDGQEPEGVEWPSPIDRFSIPKVYNNASIAAVKATVRALRGKLNASSFRDYPAECCRFMGAQLRTRGKSQVQAMLHFEGREQKTVSVDGITVPTLPGFDYTWTRGVVEASNDQGVHVPVAVCVAKIGYTGDFSALGVDLPA